jgi:hypothetical protein
MMLTALTAIARALENFFAAVAPASWSNVVVRAKALLVPHFRCLYRRAIGFWPLRPLSVVHAIASDLRKTRVVARLAAMRSAFWPATLRLM